MINQITIIGLGVIGKSIASAIRQSDFTKIIMGYDHDPKRQESCYQEGIIDYNPTNFVAAVKSADLIILAIPYTEYERVFNDLVPHLKPHTAITDTASTKQFIVKIAEKTLGKFIHNFIPSNPWVNLCDELKTPQADLFANRPIIITPDENSNAHALGVIQMFWQKMGGEIEIMNASTSDTLLASTCHLPQLLAFTFINSVKNKDNIERYLTKNFIDFTDIATRSPLIWRDLCIANRQAILQEIAEFEINLKKMKEILEAAETETLLTHFSDAELLKENL